MAISNKRKHEIIGKYIRTAAGRQRLAASMIQPLRRRRDYTSVGRKAFYVEQLPDGALPIYDKDGNLLWPKEMSYKEVRKFVKERDKEKEK